MLSVSLAGLVGKTAEIAFATIKAIAFPLLTRPPTYANHNEGYDQSDRDPCKVRKKDIEQLHNLPLNI